MDNSREVTFGGEFEKAWREMVAEPYAELAEFNNALAMWLPFALVDEPEVGTLQMQVRNALKALLMTAWTLGQMTATRKQLEERFAADLHILDGQIAAMRAGGCILERAVNSFPRENGDIERWYHLHMEPTIRALKLSGVMAVGGMKRDGEA